MQVPCDKLQCQKLGQFARPETCENWLGHVNNSLTMPTRPMKFTRYCLTQWISKLPGSFGIPRVRRYLVNVVLFELNEMSTSEITVKLKSNMHIGPVQIFL